MLKIQSRIYIFVILILTVLICCGTGGNGGAPDASGSDRGPSSPADTGAVWIVDVSGTGLPREGASWKTVPIGTTENLIKTGRVE